MSSLKCVVVTPEKTEIDVEATSVTLPLFDGEMGILKDHSPMVGRLGYGVLRITTSSGSEKHFVEGGFAQVSNNLVSVLTDKVMSMDGVSAADAETQLKEAIDLPNTNADEKIIRDRACERARALKRVVG